MSSDVVHKEILRDSKGSVTGARVVLSDGRTGDSGNGFWGRGGMNSDSEAFHISQAIEYARSKPVPKK